MATYLYIYESADRREVYIGIANSMGRVWEPHNPEAEALRDRPGSRILQTVEPFSTREDARKAEAIAIYIASLAGQRVHHIDETDNDEAIGEITPTDTGLFYTNLAGTKTTTVLEPAIYYRPGETVAYEELRNTVLVRISPDPIDERPAPFGGHGGAQFAQRAQKWWGLGKASRTNMQANQLVAVLTGQQIVLGSWRLEEPKFAYDEEAGKWSFVLADAEEDNHADLKGRTLTFATRYPFRTLGYSEDLRS
ncbi:hypothetical protein [Nesterenkonia alba]|uniref:hypothetical protein n=1 Tax=Nesterenkonia alba TaxID=515814 RepID=UPI0003B32BE6|nr:hypothetical protein [Nesterenkonia alba]